MIRMLFALLVVSCISSYTSMAEEQELETMPNKTPNTRDVPVVSEQQQPDSTQHPEIPVNIGRLSDTLIAIVPGILLHGSGHWYRGDVESSKKILFLEGVSIISLIAGYTLQTKLDQSVTFNRTTTQWFYHVGGVLFFTTWFADLIGSFRGDQAHRLSRNPGLKTQFAAGYRYLNDARRELNHHIIAHFNFKTPLWAGYAGLNWESQGKLAGLSAELERQAFSYRPLNSIHPSTIHLGIHLRRWAWLHEELTQWIIAPFIKGELALDLISTSLRSFSLFHRVSLAWERFDLASVNDQRTTLDPLIDYPLILDSGIQLNLSSDLQMNLSIMKDSTQDLRPLNENDLFWKAKVTFKQTEQVDLNAQILSGEDWSMWITVAFNLSKRS